MFQVYWSWENSIHKDEFYFMCCLLVSSQVTLWIEFLSHEVLGNSFAKSSCLEEGVPVRAIWLFTILRRETRCTHPSQEYWGLHVNDNSFRQGHSWRLSLKDRAASLSVVKQASFWKPSSWLDCHEQGPSWWLSLNRVMTVYSDKSLCTVSWCLLKPPCGLSSHHMRH